MKLSATAALAVALLAAHAASAELAPCRLKGIEREVGCGVVDMPEDPDASGGRRIAIHFAVVPALAKNRLPDPVFVLAGGPGQSAMQAAGLVAPVFSQLNARRDIVYIDQRGTGKSNGLACDAPPAVTPLAQQLSVAASQARLAQCLRRIAAEGRADLRQYATWIAVRDFDAVRAALGYERVNLWGASYGTRAALEYLRQFPTRVRSVVLDGMAPAGQPLPISLSIDGDEMLRKLVQRCAADSACQTRHPNLGAEIDSLLARSGRAPSVELRHPLTGALEKVALDRTLIAAALRVPLYAPQFAAVLPHAVTAAAAGDYAALVMLSAALTGNLAENFAEAMHHAVICAEDMPRTDAAAREAASRTRFGQTFAAIYDATCRHVPTRSVPADFYATPDADVPVLILSGGADPATPPRHGEAVAKRLKRALHLIAPNLGHGVTSQGCGPELVTRFIRHASLEPGEGACLEKLPAPTFFQLPRAENSP